MKWREGAGVRRARKAVKETADAYARAAMLDADGVHDPMRYDARRALDEAVDRLVLAVRSDARVRRRKA